MLAFDVRKITATVMQVLPSRFDLASFIHFFIQDSSEQLYLWYTLAIASAMIVHALEGFRRPPNLDCEMCCGNVHA
ncbi:hypothetical protein Y032_0014g2327 [Ancylostoma ceylanicum]|uniref:Uncharacterized protein n=1 Tax=Ancylostoma ceylanicum TaxID=53326 RepID=A0A016VA19_9BILA|nr:hypothetical protein Y032_0014g2327 [Ancylostoma ceylanicum]